MKVQAGWVALSAGASQALFEGVQLLARLAATSLVVPQELRLVVLVVLRLPLLLARTAEGLQPISLTSILVERVVFELLAASAASLHSRCLARRIDSSSLLERNRTFLGALGEPFLHPASRGDGLYDGSRTHFRWFTISPRYRTGTYSTRWNRPRELPGASSQSGVNRTLSSPVLPYR
jgi:hypothetical protein